MARFQVDWEKKIIHIVEENGQIVTSWALSTAEAAKASPVTVIDVGRWKPDPNDPIPPGVEPRKP